MTNELQDPATCQWSTVKFKKKKIDRQHKDKGATNGDQHKYYSSLCRHPKSHTYISSSKNENILRHLSIDDELYSEGSSP